MSTIAHASQPIPLKTICIKVSPDIHTKLKVTVAKKQETMSNFVEEAIIEKLNSEEADN